jgi:hypothetical protein
LAVSTRRTRNESRVNVESIFSIWVRKFAFSWSERGTDLDLQEIDKIHKRAEKMNALLIRVVLFIDWVLPL